MRWYQSGIAEAVSVSKRNGSIFVVYVEGNDDKSKEITKLIDSEDISQQLSSSHFVAIKVEENSTPHQQFSQIYKQVTVPSIFFIGKDGVPLEIITEPCTTGEFLDKLQRILQKNGINVALNQAPAELSDAFIKSEKTQESNSVECENGVCAIKPKDLPSSSKDDSEDKKCEKEEETSDEKVEKLKQIISQKREAKRAEEEENVRLKEIERRKVGQDVQKLKRWQQESELKEMLQERNKEKKEQQEARQRVLAQIAQDKAERAAKFATQNPSTSQSSSTSLQPPQRAPVISNITRLQFKLPDGSSRTYEFQNEATLQSVRDYIIANMNVPFNNFTLSTTFPRREFTVENSSQTLLELELVPNAVILILPLHHGVVSTNSESWLMTIFWSFMGPIMNFLGYVKSKLFGNSQPGPPPTNQDKKRSNEDSGETSKVTKKRFGETSVIRRQGNVHRLTDKADSDDDNNTWNGNSTQQM